MKHPTLLAIALPLLACSAPERVLPPRATGHARALRSGLSAVELLVRPRGEPASTPQDVLRLVEGVDSVSMASEGPRRRIRLEFLDRVEPRLSSLPGILGNAGYEVLEIELWAGGYLSRSLDGRTTQFRPSGWNTTFPLGGLVVPLDSGHLGVHARVRRDERGYWANEVGQWTLELLEWDT